MVNQYRLYTIREWEQAQPEGVSFSRFFLTDHSGEVRKVTGTIRVLKRKLVNGVMCRIPTDRACSGTDTDAAMQAHITFARETMTFP